jgi:hypothetical protein
VQAALHQDLRFSRAAQTDANLGGLAFGVRMNDGVGAYVDADLGCQGLDFDFVANQRGQDDACDGAFNGPLQGNVRQWPYDRHGDWGKGLATFNEFVKDVIVGRMANQAVNDPSFLHLFKIAHLYLLLATQGNTAHRISTFSPVNLLLDVPWVTFRQYLPHCEMYCRGS